MLNNLLRRHPALLAICLVAFCLVAYGPGRLENTSGDNISTRYWPVAILRYGTWTLDPFKRDLRGIDYAAIYLPGGTWAPRTTWGMLPLLLPVYSWADAYQLFGHEWTHDRISKVGRLAGIVWAIAAVIALYYFLLNFVSTGPAVLSALLFATGTWHWSLGAQGPSVQGAAVLLHVLNLHLLWRFCEDSTVAASWWNAFFLGALHAWIWSIRPQDLYLLAPVALLLLERRKTLIGYAIPLVVGVLALTQAYQSVYGTFLGPYGVVNLSGMTLYRWNPVPGLAGLLFSPNRGALVFFPLLFPLPYIWYRTMPVPSVVAAIRRAISGNFDAAVSRMQRLSLVLALASFAYFVSLVFLDFWHGSWSYGARYLYNLQPYVWLAITLAVADLWRLRTGHKALLSPIILSAFVLLGSTGVIVHGLGHRNYDVYIWNAAHSRVTNSDVWDTSNWIVAATWEAGSNRDRWPNALDRLKRFGF